MTNKYRGVDPMLTNVAKGYTNARMIASAVLPTIPVKNQAGKHYIYDRGRFRVNDTERGAGSNSNEVTLNLTTGNPYHCNDHALRQFVTDEDRDNAVSPMNPYVDATENVVDMLMIDREKAVADLVTNVSNLTQNTTLSGTDQWSDAANSDPIDDLETGMQTVHSAIGVNPNTLILGKQVWDKLKHHPDFLERIKYSQKGIVGTDLLADLIGVEKVLVGEAFYTSSDEGQTETTSYVWGKDAVLAYIAPRVAPKMITLGLNYLWNGKTMKVERMRGTDEEDRKGAYVRAGDWYYDDNIVAADAGYLLKSVVA